jgi:anti-sigma B factor antagonist
MQSFKLKTRDLRPGCREIAVEGELDLAVAGEMQAAIDAVADSELALVNLEGCQFIDSTGIALIVRGHERMAERGARLAVCGASEQVLRVLQISGLTENGLVFADAEEALSA